MKAIIRYPGSKWSLAELSIAAVIAGIILLICTEDESLEQFARRHAKRKARKARKRGK